MNDIEDMIAEQKAGALIRAHERACEQLTRARTHRERGIAQRLVDELRVKGMQLEAAAKAREQLRKPKAMVLPIHGSSRREPSR